MRLFADVPDLKSSFRHKPEEDGGITLILLLTVLTLLLTSLLCCLEFSIFAQLVASIWFPLSLRILQMALCW